MKKAFLIWDEDERDFVECATKNQYFHTRSIDAAFQFETPEEAQDVADELANAVVLQWI